MDKGKIFPDWLPIEAKCASIDEFNCVTVQVSEPPCKRCKHWKPRKSDLWEKNFYRLCWASKMYPDYSCFLQREG